MQEHGALVAHEVAKSHIAATVSLIVPPRARIGVVGPNGIGKSTLLRLLAGLEDPDAGIVERRPATLTVGYLAQEPDARPGETLGDYLARGTGVAAAEREMDALAARLASEPGLAGAYSDALDRFLVLGGPDLDARAGAVAADLALGGRLAESVDSLSGGQRARAALAAILLARHDVLLLDEPTNDLDFDGLALLDRFLAEAQGAIVVVSHDRALLEGMGRIVELSRDGAREFAGGWNEFAAERERERARRYEAFEHSVSERERLEEQVRRRREWAERGGNARRKKKTRDVAGALERRLARVERADKPFEPWDLRLRLSPRQRSGDVVARLEEAVVERGGFRLGPVELELAWGERLAVVGPNGAGKSTMLAALLGRIPLTHGRRRLGSGVSVGSLEQHREGAAEPLLQDFTGGTGLDTETARTLLAKFGLGAQHVLRPVRTLSPGERTRAALASFAALGVNLLVLDEPTNHLDLPAIEELEEALAGFEGSVVLVSHDRRFLEAFGATRTVAVEGGVVRAL